MKLYKSPYHKHIQTIYHFLTSTAPGKTDAEIAVREELLALGESWTAGDVGLAILNSPIIIEGPGALVCMGCDKKIEGPLIDFEVEGYYEMYLCLPCAKKAVEMLEKVKKGEVV